MPRRQGVPDDAYAPLFYEPGGQPAPRRWRRLLMWFLVGAAIGIGAAAGL